MSIVNTPPSEINEERPSRKAALLGDANCRPKALPVNEAGIPQELKELRQFVGWKFEWRKKTKEQQELSPGKWTKPPRQALNGKFAKVNDASTWCSFAEAWSAYEGGTFDGIGVVLTGGAGVDLDDCVNEDGTIADWAQKIITEVDTYAEYSPTGTGIKLYCYGTLPPHGRRKGNVEMYDDSSARYFTLTGQKLPNCPATLNERTAQLAAVHAKYIANKMESAEGTIVTVKPPINDLDDNAIIEKAKASNNGGAFKKLWGGSTADHGGDHSRADMALCGSLAFWVGPDESRIDRLFRQSGLMRDKWDEKRGKLTYGARTIAEALKGRTEFRSKDKNGQPHHADGDWSGQSSDSVTDDILDQAPPPDADGPPIQEPDGDPNTDKKKPSIATKIVAQAQAAGIALFHTPDQTPFVTIHVNGHGENYPIQSAVFRRWLSRLYYKATQRAANANAIADAVGILAAVATHDGEEVEVHTRSARHGNAIYIDLADAAWRAVEITRDGWRIVTEAPVKFRRPGGLYPLPEPERGGTIKLLRPFVNCKSESGFRLIVAFLTAAMRPGRPFPVLSLRGEQGSAKSTLARFLRALVDPNKAPLRRPPRDDRDMIIAATNGWIVAFDNLSFVPDWLSDGLCCLATGAGFGTRTLFTNGDETLFQATRPIILTAIEEVVTRADLMDRCLSVELEPIPDDKRRTEAEIELEFGRVQPLIFGALLDAVSVALKNLPSTRLSTMPRMADFALWVSAAEPALGWTPGAFLADYTNNREQSTEAILADSPLYDPLVRVLELHSGSWHGTASELLDALTAQAGDQASKQKTWPPKPNALTNRLKRLAPALRAIGITVQRDRQAGTGKRIVRVERKPKDCHVSSPSSPQGNCQRTEGDDLGDGDDNGGRGDSSEWSENHGFSETVTTGDSGDDVLRHSLDSNSVGVYEQGF